MGAPTTVTVPATKHTGHQSRYSGNKPNVSVSIGGVAQGHGSSLSEAKASAVASLLELATAQQSAPAATISEDVSGRLLVVYYPHGSGTDSVNIRISDEGVRRTCQSSMRGSPAENADRAAEQPDVTRVF